MFDVPIAEKLRLEYKIDIPIETDPWNVGLIVGPSGSGKSTVMRALWGEMPELSWSDGAVIDDFVQDKSVEEITKACSAVGFNTIPAWMRPFSTLSNGERFRVDVARRMLECQSPVVIDEFTSVVDRHVAQIASHAIQRYARHAGKQLVAVSCHYDIIDWLQPEWVLDMATRSFMRRRLQRRPDIKCTIGRVSRAAWSMFAPFHYLTSSLHKAATCFGLWANGDLAAFIGALHRPHPRVRDIVGVSRLVCLPDWQGIGLAMRLGERVAGAYKRSGKRLRMYPAHPALVRAFDKNPRWELKTKAFEGGHIAATSSCAWHQWGARACTVFEYCGPALSTEDAYAVLGGRGMQ
jgi:ABC-type lipoprotein export system ATPase subunit